MPDRSLRHHPLPPRPLVSGSPRDGWHGATLAREYRPAPPQERQQDGPGSAEGTPGPDQARRPDGSRGVRGPRGAEGSEGSGGQGAGGREDNPFAPPPEGAPDRPWRPRRPGRGAGSDSREGAGSDERGGRRSGWGRQWSDQQPGRTPGGGFGERPRGPGGPEGPAGQSGSGMRWDPTDPAQRRARYALLSGMWAFFFSLFGWRDLALLLGALALYWGVSSLRGKSRRPDRTAPSGAAVQQAAGAQGPGSGAGAGYGPRSGSRPQTTAAVSGLVTASLALAMVATTFTAQLVYRDYYTCVDDALTTSAKHSCDRLLPEGLRALLGTES